MFKMSATSMNTSKQARLSLVKSSSISDCSKPRHTCSRHCHSSSMSWTLVSYTRCWMTDHGARHVATELTRPKSGGLCHLVCHSAWCSGYNILRMYYKSMKCDVSFSLGSVSTLFRWGGHFCHICVKLFFLFSTVQNCKSRLRFSRVMIIHICTAAFLWFTVYNNSCTIVFHCKLYL